MEAIESNQCGFIWRAIKVVTTQQHAKPQEQAIDEELKILLSDKEDVVISKDCSFGEMFIGKEKSISVSMHLYFRFYHYY